MYNRTRRRFSLVAAGIAMACCAPLQAQEQTPRSTDLTTRSAASEGKQVTMTGKIVDLHQFMTGQKDSAHGQSTPGQTRPGQATPGTRSEPNLIDPADRDDSKPGADSKARPGATLPATGGRDRDNADKSHSMKKNQIMGLETSTGLVIVYMKEAPSVFATPRTDTDSQRPGTTTPGADTKRPGTTPDSDSPRPGTTTPRPGTTTPNDSDRLQTGSDDKDHADWQDKQVQVTGTMYEKNGIKFLVVTKIDKSGSTTPGSTPGASDRPDSTIPGSLPRPGTTPSKPRE